MTVAGSGYVESMPLANRISTGRYTLITFLPRNLFEQFQRVPNLWFLLVSIFQLAAVNLTPTTGWATMAPLLLLLCVSMSKDAYIDFKRHRQDREINEKPFAVWDGESFVPRKCQDIVAGHLILLRTGDFAPADLLLLASGHPKDICYVDISGLLGETNLKVKTAIKATKGFRHTDLNVTSGSLHRLQGEVYCQDPDVSLERFDGRIKLKGFPTAERVGLGNLILRGSVICSTPWIISVALYTGKETKIMLNAHKVPLKNTRVERLANKMMLALIFACLVLALTSTFLNTYQAVSESEDNFFITFLVFVMLYQNITPISLFVTLDILRMYQMWHHRQHSRKSISSAEVLNSCVAEDLGRVEYIIADKTGTLTESWGAAKEFVLGEDSFSPCAELHSGCKHMNELVSVEPESESVDRSVPCGYTNLRRMLASFECPKSANTFMEALAVCNSILLSDGGYEMVFVRDDKALVTSAADFGYQLLEKTADFCRLDVKGEERRYKILGQHESTGVIPHFRIALQREDSSEGLLFIKGTPHVLSLNRKAILHLSTSAEFVVTRKEDELIHSGLKSIMIACKVLKGEELTDLKTKLEIANRAIYNREDKIEKIFDMYECGCEYLGLVGVEEGVLQSTGDAVQRLVQAGVHIWVASGDESAPTQIAAINAKILDPNIRCVMLKMPKNGATASYLRRKLNIQVKRLILNQHAGVREEVEDENNVQRGSLWAGTTAMLFGNSFIGRSSLMLNLDEPLKEVPYDPENITKYAVLVTGETFDLALKDQECKRLLCCILFLATTVLFCNMLPLQKAQVVKLIKENFRFRPVTLAIGDGNDDVAMLQEADIGVGMKREGESRASSNADVAVGYFHQLASLLLVDGRWYLQRYSKTAILFIYKNMLVTMVLFGYVFRCDYQPTQLIDTGLMTLYNIIFTSIPVLCIGLWDEDVSESMILRHPEMYRMRITIFGWRWMLFFGLIALFQSLTIYFSIFPSLLFSINSSGMTENFASNGTILFISLVLTVLAQVSLEMSTITITYVCSLLLSLLLLLIYLLAGTYINTSDLFGVLNTIFENPISVIRFVLPAMGAAGFGYCTRTFQRLFFPQPVDELRTHACIKANKLHNRAYDFCRNLKQMYRASHSAVEIEEKDAFRMAKYTLHFRSEYVERSYRWSYIQSHLSQFRVFNIVLTLLLIAWLAYGIASGASPAYTIIRSGIIILSLAVLYLTRWNVFQRRYVAFVAIAIIVSLFARFLTEMLFLYDGSLIAAIYPLATYTMVNVDVILVGTLNCLNIVLFAISGSVYYALASEFDGIDAALFMISYIVILIGVTVMAAMLGYHLINGDRKEFQLFQQTCVDVQRCRDILGCLLPEFVRARVREGARYIAEEKGIVSIIFCDIYDFDSIIATMKPNEITEFLDDLFQKFDELCNINGVVKIETVGKTYMACAGLKDSEGELDPHLKDICHARRAIEMALSILRTLENYYLPDGTQIKAKIGINSGPVVAGVVGFHKPQFSLVGDTVNTASRMCSTIDTTNTIQISEAVYSLLQDKRGINFQPKFLSNVKGKGSMNTFLVSEADLNTASTDLGSELQDEGSFAAPQMTLPKSPTSIRSQFEIDHKKHIFNPVLDPERVEPITFLSCKCKESALQQKFRLSYLKSNRSLMTSGLYTATVVRLLVMFIRIAELYYDPISTSKEHVIAYAVLSLTTLMAALAVRKLLYWPLFSYIMQLMYAVNVVFILFDVIFEAKYEVNLMALEVMYCLLQLAHCSGFFFREVVLGCTILVAEWAIATPWSRDPVKHGGCLVFIVGFACINVYAQYSHESKIRLYDNMVRYANKEIENTDQLLSQMVPKHVLKKLKEDGDTTDILPNVTVLFADIVGFTNWSSDKLPVEVVGMLSDMFTRFDRLAVLNHVYKVHTIGDCYVVMGFAALDVAMREPGQECLNTVKMAFDMIDVINAVNEENGSQLNMRIGLHTGTVIGGIAGTNIVRYDVYGPDVALANKMESNGQAGKVNVSDVTRQLMEDTAPGEFYYLYNKDVGATSLGVTHRCFLVSELFARRTAQNPSLFPLMKSQSVSRTHRSQETADIDAVELDNVRDRHIPKEFIPFYKNTP